MTSPRSAAPLAVAVGALAAAWFAAVPARADDGCGICHGAERVQHATSAHRAADIGCVGCHGGDGSAVDDKARAHAKEKGFRGPTTRKETVLACGSCHEDVRRMRPFALRTDALAAYRTSHHGKAVLERGEEDAAVCTDCHGVHDVRRVRDARSPAHRQNVPATCGRCHADAALMARHGVGATAPAEFAKSVHGRRLADGEPGVPSCADCHDAHAATPAGATEVAEVCGNCHAEPRDQFRRSPHFAASQRGRMKQCITCHGNHAIAAPGYALFDAETDAADEATGATRCLACHGADAPGGRAAEVARRFGSELRSVDELLRDAASEVRRVSDAGFLVDDERDALGKARRALVATIPLTHSCDTVQVDASLRRARSLANDALEGCAKRVRESRDRRIFGSAAALLLFGVSAFLSLRRRTKGKP